MSDKLNTVKPLSSLLFRFERGPGIAPALQVDSLPAEPQGKPKDTGVGILFLFQQIFLIQESNRDLLHCRWILNQLRDEGRPLFFSLKIDINTLTWSWSDGKNKVRGHRKIIMSIPWQNVLDREKSASEATQLWQKTSLWQNNRGKDLIWLAGKLLVTKKKKSLWKLKPCVLARSFPVTGPQPLSSLRQILYKLSHKGSPRMLEKVPYPFSSRFLQPRNQTGALQCRGLRSDPCLGE